jgi:signal transduction histidine kinase
VTARLAGRRCRGGAVGGWARLGEVVTTEAVTTWRHLARQGTLLLAWWLLPAAAAIITGLITLPTQPATAIALLTVGIALLGRFTRPITALLAGTGVATVAPILPSMILSALLWPVTVLLAFAVGRRVRDTRRTVMILAIATGVQVAAKLADQAAGPEIDPVDASLAVVIAVLLVVLPGAIGMLQAQRVQTMDALQERNALLERANLLGEAQARMQERARIAGEMHDLLGHRLSLIVLYAGALEVRTRAAAPEINEQADLVRTTSRTALDELRTVLGILRLDGAERPDGTDAVVGTRKDVTTLVAEAEQAGLPITLTWHGDDLTDAGAGVRRAVNRIVRESLTNVHKHAPGAPTRAAVTVDTDKLTITVRNIARPPAVPPPSSGLGLPGLRERARLAGGDLTAGKDPITGDYTVTAILALRPGGPDPTGPFIDRSAPADRQLLPLRPETEEAFFRPTSPGKTKPAYVALAVVAVVLCGGLGFGFYYIAESGVSPQTYQQINIGDTQDRVRELTGGDNAAARTIGEAEQPTAPPGTTCDYTLADGSGNIFRFCFKDGTLTQKDEIQTS